jgi:hypothetical protein
MDLLNAFDWAFNKAMAKAEDKHLDPPTEHSIKCHYCGGKGYYGEDRSKREELLCDICLGAGEMDEPEEWKDDAYWEAAYDRAKEARESGGEV